SFPRKEINKKKTVSLDIDLPLRLEIASRNTKHDHKNSPEWPLVKILHLDSTIQAHRLQNCNSKLINYDRLTKTHQQPENSKRIKQYQTCGGFDHFSNTSSTQTK
ncbi:hypothetical protein M758_12G047800, partial [Ceratodon purpureus]